MNLGPFALVWVGLGIAGFVLSVRALRRRQWIDVSKDKVRRGGGHALLGLQELIEPSVEYILAAENLEPKEEDDIASDDDNDEIAEIMKSLAESLSLAPIDHEEVRRSLAEALRAGLNWREVYEDSVRNELQARPFRAPSIPPSWRVAPRERTDDASSQPWPVT